VLYIPYCVGANGVPSNEPPRLASCRFCKLNKKIKKKKYYFIFFYLMNSDQTSSDQSRAPAAMASTTTNNDCCANLEIIEYDPHIIILKWGETVLSYGYVTEEKRVQAGTPETSIVFSTYAARIPHVALHYVRILLNAELSDLCLMQIPDGVAYGADDIVVSLNARMEIRRVGQASSYHPDIFTDHDAFYTRYFLCRLREPWCGLK
jgi:hypothetical protein